MLRNKDFVGQSVDLFLYLKQMNFRPVKNWSVSLVTNSWRILKRDILEMFLFSFATNECIMTLWLRLIGWAYACLFHIS